MSSCPCQSQKNYMDCCGKFIMGDAIPSTPEELMRSRYCAYSQANINYIMQTMQGPAAKDFNKKEAELWAKSVTWEGLEVLSHKEEVQRGWVEFKAHYSSQGKKYVIHELSEFHREDNRWFYFSGTLFEKV